tara:strand:+ start:148 stop:531 length:384 start_codon:yes stop_codon:yes gene_type:complete
LNWKNKIKLQQELRIENKSIENWDSFSVNKKDKIIGFLALNYSFIYISKKYDLSYKFIIDNLWPIAIKSLSKYRLKHNPSKYKDEPYYKDEMSYGALNISYDYNDLNKSEIKAYNNYNEKNKAYYVI